MSKTKELFWTFFKIGAFTFGGGYAMVALLQNEFVEEKKWVTKEEFLAAQGEQFLDEHFDGSLPKFLAAFSHRKRLSEKEVAELKKLIEEYEEGENDGTDS